MIGKKRASFDSIKKDILSYISSRSDSDEVYNKIPPSNLSLIVDLVAGYSAYNSYKYYAEANQTYLSTATREDSVHRISNVFGYNINRYRAPAVRIRYMGIPTITLNRGAVLGTYNEYQLIYWGPTKRFEKLDDIEIIVGYVNSQTYTVDDNQEVVEYVLDPLNLKSVDDYRIQVRVDGSEVEVTKDIEAYLIRGQVIDFSNSNVSTTISVSDRKYAYGANVKNSIEINWVETNGHDPSIDLNEFKMTGEFKVIDLISEGINGETIEEIRKMAPLFYSTMRRMVSIYDHEYIIKSAPMIKDATVEIEPGVPYVVKLELRSLLVGRVYSISTPGRYHTYETKEGDTLESIRDYFLLSFRNDDTIEILMSGDYYFTIQMVDNMVSPKLWHDGFDEDIIEQWVRPRCCTIMCHYVHANTVDGDPVVMTRFEVGEMGDWLEPYKMVGYRILFSPAEPVDIEYKFKVGVVSEACWDYVSSEVRRIVNNYHLKVGAKIYYGDILAEIGKIAMEDELGQLTNVVTHVEPDQELFDIELGKSRYSNILPISITQVNSSTTTV